MDRIRLAAGLLAAALGVGAPGLALAAKSENDLQVTMKLSATNTVAPIAKIKVKNKGTATQAGVIVRVLSENGGGQELYSETVTLAGGQSASLTARIYLDAAITCLVATADPTAGADQVPTDNIARAPMGLKGAAGSALVGRSTFLASCASCHGSAAGGIGDAPSLVGASSSTLLAKTAAGGNHDFPWFSKNDGKSVSTFLKNPAGVQMPPALPTPPPGGWPAYQNGGVKDLLDARCIECHGNGRVEAAVWLNTYVAASKMAPRSLAAVKRGSMPQTGKHFTAEEIALLQNWITGGLRP
jgi:mono/diheme cytochrome c family protein